MFAVLSAAVETKLYAELSSSLLLGPRVALTYALFSGLSTGMSHASVAYLPSSFAMHLFTLSLAYLVRYVSNEKKRSSSIVKGLLCITTGGFLGWPFVLALAPVWGLHYLATSLFDKLSFQSFTKSVAKVIIGASVILAAIIGIDSIAYRKLEIVPLNIVLYNVINTSADSGPDIFGTEPWTYYIMNLALNFNIAWPLALISLICVPIQKFFRPKHSSISLLLVLLPMFIWLGIFTAQPHKEERFMYIIYGSLCLNAAVTVEILSMIVNKLPGLPKASGSLINTGIVALFTLLSLSRSIALTHYYGAPVQVFSQFQLLPESINSAENICIGREWYRFPSSYFLDVSADKHLRLKFIQSGFTGLLPGEFAESDIATDTSSWWWNLKGTSAIPSGMNNKNQQDLSKYVPVEACRYIIDADFETSETEIRFTQDSENWTKLYCTKFLDTSASRGIARLLYIPESLHKIFRSKLVWTDYCLLENNLKAQSS